MLNINIEMSKSNIKSITIQNKSVIVYVCFVLFLVCLYTCVCECLLQKQQSLKTAGKWRKREPYFGASTLWLAAWAGHELDGSAPHQCR